jgi:hypothetical protein
VSGSVAFGLALAEATQTTAASASATRRRYLRELDNAIGFAGFIDITPGQDRSRETTCRLGWESLD